MSFASVQRLPITLNDKDLRFYASTLFYFKIFRFVKRLCRPGRLVSIAHYYFPTFATVLSRTVYDSFHKSRPWSTFFDFFLYLFLDYRRYSQTVSYYICLIHFSNPINNCFPRRFGSKSIHIRFERHCPGSFRCSSPTLHFKSFNIPPFPFEFCSCSCTINASNKILY